MYKNHKNNSYCRSKELNESSMEAMEPVTYDKQGRMKYHPEFHAKQKQPWTTSEQKFLIENYEQLGPEQISLEMERTVNTVMRRASDLRKQGLLVKPAKKRYHKRTITSLRRKDQQGK
jgi:hypothetical protein